MWADSQRRGAGVGERDGLNGIPAQLNLAEIERIWLDIRRCRWRKSESVTVGETPGDGGVGVDATTPLSGNSGNRSAGRPMSFKLASRPPASRGEEG